MKIETNKGKGKKKSSRCFFTFGYVEMLPQPCTGKNGKDYYNVKLTLFGGMTVYALVYRPEQAVLHSFVGVRGSLKKDGQMSYVVFQINNTAKDFICDAAEYSRNAEPDTKDYDFDDELPF